MEPQEPPRPKPDDPVELLMAHDLDRLSLDELDRRIRLLEAEIDRTRARRATAGSVRSAADELFRR